MRARRYLLLSEASGGLRRVTRWVSRQKICSKHAMSCCSRRSTHPRIKIRPSTSLMLFAYWTEELIRADGIYRHRQSHGYFCSESWFKERHLYASLTGLVLRRTCLAQREIRSLPFLTALCQSVGHGLILCRYVSLAINVSDPNQDLICFPFAF